MSYESTDLLNGRYRVGAKLAEGGMGAQILFRRLPMGLTFAYIPKGPVCGEASEEDGQKLWQEVDEVCRKRKAIFLKVEPDGWEEE